jgi:hypothetical protein
MVGVSIRYANRSAWLNILVAKLFCGHVDRERGLDFYSQSEQLRDLSHYTTHLVWKD